MPKLFCTCQNVHVCLCCGNPASGFARIAQGKGTRFHPLSSWLRAAFTGTGVSRKRVCISPCESIIRSWGRRRLIRGLLYLCLHEALPTQHAPRSLLLRLFVMHRRIFGSPHMLRRSYFGRFVGPHSEKSWDVWLTQIGYESWKCGERGVGDSKRRKERGQKSRFHILKSIIRLWH